MKPGRRLASCELLKSTQALNNDIGLTRNVFNLKINIKLKGRHDQASEQMRQVIIPRRRFVNHVHHSFIVSKEYDGVGSKRLSLHLQKGHNGIKFQNCNVVVLPNFWKLTIKRTFLKNLCKSML